jgi:hypothetical protein
MQGLNFFIHKSNLNLVSWHQDHQFVLTCWTETPKLVCSPKGTDYMAMWRIRIRKHATPNLLTSELLSTHHHQLYR